LLMAACLRGGWWRWTAPLTWQWWLWRHLSRCPAHAWATHTGAATAAMLFSVWVWHVPAQYIGGIVYKPNCHPCTAVITRCYVSMV
jgi:hypothetical protein